MNQKNLLIVTGSAVVVSIASAIHSYVSGKRIKRLETDIENRGKDIFKQVEWKSTDLTNSIENMVKDLNKTLTNKVNSISDSLNVDIPDDILEAALKKAAEERAKTEISAASRRITDDYTSSIRSEVRKSVDLAYANTKGDVKRELERQIADVDIYGIKREILDDAKEKVEEELEDAIKELVDKFEEDLDDAREKANDKFEEELDSITTRFTNDLERGSKIYKTLSEKLGTA